MSNSIATCPTSAFTFFLNYVSNLTLEPQPPQPPLFDSYDFVIVGGGTAGCVLANRLSEVPKWKVLLIEAGPEEPAIASVPALAVTLRRQPFLTWNYSTVPVPRLCNGQPCSFIRGKMLGGCSSLGGMSYTRGTGRCFDRWSEAGNIGWSYRDLLPYFKKSEDNRDIDVAADTVHHSVGGYLSVQRPRGNVEFLSIMRRVFENEGYSYNNDDGVSRNGFGFAQLTYFNGERRSTNRAFLEPVRHKRPNLHVLTNSVVTKILVNPRTKIAEGVQVRVGNSSNGIIFVRREVILSAGTFASPQLLQISGIGPSRVLSSLRVPVIKILEGVGNNLHDHAASSFNLRLKRTNPYNVTLTWRLIQSYIDHYNIFRTGPLTGNSNTFVYDFSKYSDDSIADLAGFFNILDSQNCGTHGTTGIFVPFDTITITASLRTARSRGSVTARSKNVFQQPEIVSGLIADDVDFATFVEAHKMTYRIGQSEMFRKLGFTLDRTPLQRCSKFKFGTSAYFKCVSYGASFSTFHPVGTCKMGPTWDENAVVNPRLKVYGIPNLRVIDESIIPENVDKNTMAPVIMIAEKGADMIKEDWFRLKSGFVFHHSRMKL